MLGRELTTCTLEKARPIATRRSADRRRGVISVLQAVTSGLTTSREAGPVRERFEEELRALVRARAVVLREDGASGGTSLCIELPGGSMEHRARLEVAFEPGSSADPWTRQLLEAGSHVAALLLELERAQARYAFRVKPRSDGAAPLIGSSPAIRTLRERIERVAGTDFTVLIEGASGPEPHPSFIEVVC